MTSPLAVTCPAAELRGVPGQVMDFVVGQVGGLDPAWLAVPIGQRRNF